MLRTILAVSLLLTCSVGRADVAFHSAHVMVVDETSGEVLLKKDIDAAAPIASLSKLMTAMVVLDAQQDPNEDLRIDIADTDDLKHSRGGVPVGALVSRGSLLELTLLASDNRAASALAHYYPGGLRAFDAAMQRKIHALGLNSTSIAEPTGLSPSNMSSAQDMVLVLRAAARYPVIAQITSRRSHIVLVNGRTRIVQNTNRLVGGAEWQVLLSKTGFTNEAGRCLGMQARASGRTVTVVLIGAARPSGVRRDSMTIRRWLATEQRAGVHSSGERAPLVAARSRTTALELDRRRADGGTTETAAAVVESIGKPAEEGTTESAAEPKAN
jgi:D-alanyl-D-alanine carboxypeptidase/D-alanyl-D-alanine endopeptidase (penicillin-binding protein 7)